MSFNPRSNYNEFFSGSIIEPTTISGNKIVIDKDTQLSWPSFYIEGSVTLNRIMNISVLGDFRVYLPDATKSSLFSDSLILSLGPYPLKLYEDKDSVEHIMTIGGAPSYTYALTTKPIEYIKPFFEINNDAGSENAHFIEITSPVAANSVLIKGFRSGAIVPVPVQEVLSLSNGTVRTKNTYNTITSILNTSDVDLTNVTVQIPPVIGSVPWLYFGDGTIEAPIGLSLPAYASPAKADLKQTLDPLIKAQQLTFKYKILNNKSALFTIIGYVDGLLEYHDIITESQNGIYETLTTEFSSVISLCRVTTTEHDGDITDVSLVYPETDTSKAFTISKKEGLVEQGTYLDTNYQPNLTPRMLTIKFTVPANTEKGNITIRGTSAPTREEITDDEIEFENKTTENSDPIEETTISLFSTVTEIHSSQKLINVTLTYPANNGKDAIIMVNNIVLEANTSKTNDIVNPQIMPSIVYISAKGTGPVELLIKGTDQFGEGLDESVSLMAQTNDDLPTITGKSIQKFVTVTECINTSNQELTDFSIKISEPQTGYITTYFYHVDTDIFGNDQDLSNDLKSSKSDDYNMKNRSLMLTNNLNHDSGSPEYKNLLGQVDIAAIPGIANYVGSSYTEPVNSITREKVPIKNRGYATEEVVYIKENFGLYTNVYYENLPTETKTWYSLGFPSAQINYPYPFIAPNKLTVSSVDEVKVKIHGYVEGSGQYYLDDEEFTVKAGVPSTTKKIFFMVEWVRIQGKTSGFSLINKAQTYYGNDYPDFYIVRTQPVDNFELYIYIYQRAIYDAINPRLIMPRTSSDGSDDTSIWVLGVDIWNNLISMYNSHKLYSYKEPSNKLDYLTAPIYLPEYIRAADNQYQDNILCLGWAPNAESLAVNTFFVPAGHSQNISNTNITNIYARKQLVEALKHAVLQKLPPPTVTYLYVWCDEITGKDAYLLKYLYIEGTNNPSLFDQKQKRGIISETVPLKPGHWVRTTKQYLYIFNVSTYIPLDNTSIIPNVPIGIIKNIKVRSEIHTPLDNILIELGNSTILHGNSRVPIENNPPSDLPHGIQYLTVHGNNGASVFISGKDNTGIDQSETVSIGKTGEAQTNNQYNYLNYIENLDPQNLVTGCYIIGNEVLPVDPVVFVAPDPNDSTKGCAKAASRLPLNGNPPLSYPSAHLEIMSHNTNHLNFLYIEGKDEAGLTIWEELNVQFSKNVSGKAYSSISKILNCSSGESIATGLTVKTIADDGEAHYIYTVENDTAKGKWESINFGAFLSTERGKSIAGNGLFFKDGALNESIKVLHINNSDDFSILPEHNGHLLICTPLQAATDNHSVWTLPKASATLDKGMFVYVLNPPGSPVQLVVHTSGTDCFNGVAEIKSFTLDSSESIIFVCVTENGIGSGWATICGNVESVSNEFSAVSFPVKNQSTDIPEDWFSSSNDTITLNCKP